MGKVIVKIDYIYIYVEALIFCRSLSRTSDFFTIESLSIWQLLDKSFIFRLKYLFRFLFFLPNTFLSLSLVTNVRILLIHNPDSWYIYFSQLLNSYIFSRNEITTHARSFFHPPLSLSLFTIPTVWWSSSSRRFSRSGAAFRASPSPPSPSSPCSRAVWTSRF